MTQPLLFDDKPRARRSDPVESHAAARSVEDVRESQRAVLECLSRFGPITDEQLVRIYLDWRVTQLWPQH